MSDHLLFIADAGALYARHQTHADVSDHLNGIMAKYDLQGLGYLVGSSGNIRGYSAEAETGAQRSALHKWMAIVVHHLDAHPNERKELGAGAVVLVAVERDGTVRVVTWSKEKGDCTRIQPFVDRLFTQVSVAPFRVHFGWGNQGVPKPLSRMEVDQIGPRAMAQMEGMV